MRRPPAGVLLAALLAALVPQGAAAQSWRLRFEAAAQRVAFRGVTPDSVTELEVITGPTGGPVSPDGYAVNCFGDGYCRFYRPGAIRRGIPASVGADLTMWGLGVRGLSIRVSSRMLGDLSGDRLWPGTSPALRLVEGYAEYVNGGLVARAGRVIEQGRLGSSGGGLDGARATLRFDRLNLTVGGYLGWGLARGTVLSVTSPAVNPLAEFQPGERQIVAGALAGLHLRPLDAEAEYRREVDPATDYFVSERVALSLQARPDNRIRLVAGADYDLAQGHFGSADATLSYARDGVWATVGGRHYRPFFDLWTVWGVFSPVPYNAVNGSLAVRLVPAIQVRASGEWFRYEPADASTPTVDLEEGGWRWAVEATATPSTQWSVQLRVHDELRPGASARGFDGRVSWRPREVLELAAEGGRLVRPLELRFQDAGLSWAGASADYRLGERLRIGASVDHYWEARDRPDSAAFDWNQWRLSARVSLTLRSAADRWSLPPARRSGSVP